ncbi:hypothetical protein A9308_04240 [Moraxella atlantae]|uniref:Uncharacterized protein n=1 Tax=Faucicola atlantae TaxID=34059 RepID=A0A1B8QE07_9GAMM|nr:hypothetical protein [Moraxella atlantae]OBX79851.1 hypothetical protein A9308_04240 [Moraxella atlantae]OPH34046.1 hypothetical protein B5J92_08590 [Moraxella atlantae]
MAKFILNNIHLSSSHTKTAHSAQSRVGIAFAQKNRYNNCFWRVDRGKLPPKRAIFSQLLANALG